MTNQKQYLDLGKETSSVHNFCAFSSEVILWEKENKWWHPEMLAVFSCLNSHNSDAIWTLYIKSIVKQEKPTVDTEEEEEEIKK